MDNPDPHGAVSSVIRILRRTTRIVQLAPFAYLVFYAVYLLAGSFISEEMLCLTDSVMTVSPITTIGMLVASRMYKLCRWHKAACLLPTTSQVEGYIDSFVFTFTQEEIIIINVSLGIAALFFLAAAIKHFSHGRKRTHQANA